MKNCLALCGLVLSPAVAWCGAVTIGAPASDVTSGTVSVSAQPMKRVLFGGLYTLYDFANPSSGPVAVDVQGALVEETVDAAAEHGVPEGPSQVVTGSAVIVINGPDVFAVIRDTAPADPALVGDKKPRAIGVVNGVPEPASLALTGLALLVVTWLRLGPKPVPATVQPRSSRRRILPTALFGKSSRNSTILGRL